MKQLTEDEARALGLIDPPQHDRHIHDWLMGRAEELERKIAAARAEQENP